MNWGKMLYDEKEIKLLTIIILATEIYRKASNKEFLYGNFTSQGKPYEPLLYEGEELSWLRDWSENLVVLAMKECTGRIIDELDEGRLRIIKYGKRAGHIWDSSRGLASTGVWSTRLGGTQRMLAAIHYKPIVEPGMCFTLNTENEPWSVTCEQVSTSWCQRSYEVDIQKPKREYNEKFWCSEGYESYYWNILMWKQPDFVPYPFDTLIEERRANGKSLRIEV